jgi:hypothetical protein
MTLASSDHEGEMAKENLMSYADFEAFIAKSEWVSNDHFDHETHPDHPWFRVDTTAVSQGLDEASTMVLNALGTIPKEDVELRHLERNALELRRVMHGPAKKIFCMGSAGKLFDEKIGIMSTLTIYFQKLQV